MALALGDALAVALMEGRGFTAEAFARNHPGGQLGRNLHLKVSDVMHPIDQVACLTPDAGFRELIISNEYIQSGVRPVFSGTED